MDALQLLAARGIKPIVIERSSDRAWAGEFILGNGRQPSRRVAGPTPRDGR